MLPTCQLPILTTAMELSSEAVRRWEGGWVARQVTESCKQGSKQIQVSINIWE